MIPLRNSPRDYAWGSTSLIAELEGREPGGAPEAEIWYGDHPGSPACTPDGRSLGAVLEERGAPPLPYLVKLLAAGSSLSIQAHPSRAEARDGFVREDAAGIPRDAATRNYRDDNHKPELIVALSERFRALVGLRPLERTRALLTALGAGADPIAERLSAGEAPDALRETIAWALSGDATAEIAMLEEAVDRATSAEFAEEIDVLRGIARDYPGDGGIVVAVLMNLLVLRRGEALFTPAGALHAYQDGLGVEVMAASDNVLRGGLTPKHVDVTELLQVLDTTPAEAERLRPAAEGAATVFAPGIPDFRVQHVLLAEGGVRSFALRGPTLVLCTAGRVSVGTDADDVALAPGRAVLAVDEQSLAISGAGEAFVVEPGEGALASPSERDTPMARQEG